jgi:hypothetical protein
MSVNVVKMTELPEWIKFRECFVDCMMCKHKEKKHSGIFGVCKPNCTICVEKSQLPVNSPQVEQWLTFKCDACASMYRELYPNPNPNTIPTVVRFSTPFSISPPRPLTIDKSHVIGPSQRRLTEKTPPESTPPLRYIGGSRLRGPTEKTPPEPTHPPLRYPHLRYLEGSTILVDKNIEKVIYSEKMQDPKAEYEIIYNRENHMYSMRMRGVMMIDIDFDKSKLKDMDDVIHQAKIFSKKYKDSFRIFESNGGAHVFLTNRTIHKGKDEMNGLFGDDIKYMLRFGCDKYYIAFCSRKGCLVRLNKKHETDTMYKFVRNVNESEELPEITKLIDKHLDYCKIYSLTTVNGITIYRKNIIDEKMPFINYVENFLIEESSPPDIDL